MTRAARGYRLPAGGVTDRSRTLNFTFDGEVYAGHPGDTLCSALIAEGVNLVARSLKYHRPRGFYGAGLEDPQAMLAVRDAYGYDPAIRAGQIRLVEGLEARSVTGWPSVRFDVGAFAQLTTGAMPAGFYYKTFKWPDWHLFEPMIRRATGFGRLDSEGQRRRTELRHEVCDVLVVGAGPAGLSTARALRGSGLKVVVADDQPTFGGSLLWERAELDAQSAVSFGAALQVELASDANFVLLTDTLVTGAYEGNMFTLVQTLRDTGGVRGQRHWKLRARQVVLASGMIDRPLLFEGNDRPGIMLSSAVRRLIGEFGVAPAKRLTVYTNNDSGYLTAINAARAGIDVAAVVDTRPERLAVHHANARSLGIACHFDSQIERAVGYRRLDSIVVRDGRMGSRRIACDGLAVAGGWTPLIHLAAHRGAKPSYDRDRSLFRCLDLPEGWFAAGGADGALDLETAVRGGEQAAEGIAASQATCRPVKLDTASPLGIRAETFGTVSPQWLPTVGRTSRMFVDLQNDVKVSDIELAVRENYCSVEHLKRYTTLGMGTDQGRTSNVNGLGVLAALCGADIAEVGTTSFRPPYSAVRMGTVAAHRSGDWYKPRRLLPADALHRALGAVMQDFGWERPAWYAAKGETREIAVTAERMAVREHAGIFDASSLGKLEITGPDAADFLSRFYVHDFRALGLGRIRYSLMLNDDGVIFDDGVVTCVGPNHFLASPTSGNTEAVAARLERWRQTEWPGMKVAISNVTSQWATIAIAGPRARQLLRRLEPTFEISNAAFPHMAYRQGLVTGIPARVSRVSFTGELQYEVSVPARHGADLLAALLRGDSDLSPQPIGMYAWLELRLEKGYLHLGSDTNGRTTPLDVGMDGVVSRRKGDFIGKRSLSLSFASSPQREQLVGLTALSGAIEAGGRILAPGRTSVPCPTEGYVTSACFSPSRGKFVALALLERGRQRGGETVTVYSHGDTTLCRVGDPVFYDPGNERLLA